jgi:hypothetical protein
VGEWNTMEVELKGDVTRVKLNGKLVNAFRGDQTVPERKMWFEQGTGTPGAERIHWHPKSRHPGYGLL